METQIIDNKTLENKVNSALFKGIWHSAMVVQEMKDLLRITDPSRMSPNIETFKQKRDESKHVHVKMYWHNKIKSLFEQTYYLIKNMSKTDEEYYGFTKDDIKKVLRGKMDEYEVKTYKNRICKTF